VPVKLKITKVLGDGRPHPSKYGEMIAYPITVEDESGVTEDVAWSRKPNSPAPTEGMMLEADGTYPVPDGAPEGAHPRLKGAKVLDEDGNPIVRRSESDGGGSYGARKDDPLVQARIARSVAQKAAAQFVTGAMQAGIAPNSDEIKKWRIEAMQTTEFFEDHMNEIGREAAKSDKENTNAPPF
jgi:hypothetical protein